MVLRPDWVETWNWRTFFSMNTIPTCFCVMGTFSQSSAFCWLTNIYGNNPTMIMGAKSTQSSGALNDLDPQIWQLWRALTFTTFSWGEYHKIGIVDLWLFSLRRSIEELRLCYRYGSCQPDLVHWIPKSRYGKNIRPTQYAILLRIGGRGRLWLWPDRVGRKAEPTDN